MTSRNWIKSAVASASLLFAGAATAQTSIYSENFDAVPLQASVDELGGGTTPIPNAWSPTLPNWNIDRSQMPGIADPATDGVTEWAGFSVAAKTFWGVATDNQTRQEFTKATGNLLVADPDEWDDAAHTPGLFRTFATTPSINVSNIQPGTLKIAFDSAWRPEADDDSALENNQTALVDVSFDGGATFTNVLTWTSREAEPTFHDDNVNESVSLDVTLPNGVSSMHVRFGLTDAENDWFWAVDNVDVTGVVVPEPAGLGLVGVAGLAMLRRRRAV
jgi:MYXO-CTERM domain-containing protein